MPYECYGGDCTGTRIEVLQLESDVTRGGPVKEDEDIIDPHSTGRKRAAAAYPLKEGMVCEWAGLASAGGGLPIIGCVNLQNPIDDEGNIVGNLAVHRHHGPDKNTLNNTEGNVHRICNFCHNRWHTRNDPVYNEIFGTVEWKKHNPEGVVLDLTTLISNELEWRK
jgi:hypothetical protein